MWVEIWKMHRMGMRVKNFQLQLNSLSTARPLFASATKSNYTTAIAHYLSIIETYPSLKEQLQYCALLKFHIKTTRILPTNICTLALMKHSRLLESNI